MKRLFVNIREKDNFEDLGKMGDNTKIYICDKVCGYTNKVRQAQNRNERKVL
jgi:rubrerythrin